MTERLTIKDDLGEGMEQLPTLPLYISKENWIKSRKANKLFEKEILPELFYCWKYEFEEVGIIDGGKSERNKVFDNELATDYKVLVKDDTDPFGGSDSNLFQVRSLSKVDYNSVTISVAYSYGSLCKWFKLDVLSYFVWVFHVNDSQELTDWIVMKDPKVLRALIRDKKIDFYKRKNSRTGQIFCSIPITELETHGLIHLRKGEIPLLKYHSL